MNNILLVAIALIAMNTAYAATPNQDATKLYLLWGELKAKAAPDSTAAIEKRNDANVDGARDAETLPLRFKFSGFSTIEFEQSKKFGYNSTTSTGAVSIPNFSNTINNTKHQTETFYSNFNISVAKDKTSLQSVLQIGEVYFGDSTTGGQQGGLAGNIIKVRNLYLEHLIDSTFTARGGLITLTSDPRLFIYNDHTAAANLLYVHEFINLNYWHGVAQQSRPGSVTMSHDVYDSIQANFNMPAGVKNTIYGLYRSQNAANFATEVAENTYSTVTGHARSYWLGGTFVYSERTPVSTEASFIGNWNSFSRPEHKRDDMFAYLANLKIIANINSPKLSLIFEGLMTSGARSSSDPVSGNKVLGTRAAFSSPVAACYLLTVATNDGLDDAVGTPKQSIIGNLNNDEGLQILVATVSGNITDALLGFIRYGNLRSRVDSNRSARSMGDEVDIGGTYSLGAASLVSAEYGNFFPGNYYLNRGKAELFSLKYKYNF